jgi:hypothetical protein
MSRNRGADPHAEHDGDDRRDSLAERVEMLSAYEPGALDQFVRQMRELLAHWFSRAHASINVLLMCDRLL